MEKMTALEVYLSGEIHTDWREKIQSGASDLNLSVKFHSPVTDHDSSDDCGVVILGHEKSPFWKGEIIGAFWLSVSSMEKIQQLKQWVYRHLTMLSLCYLKYNVVSSCFVNR